MTILAWDGKKLATDTAVTSLQGGATFVTPMDCFKLHSMEDLQRGRDYEPGSYTEIRDSKIRNIAVCGSTTDAELMISFVLSKSDITFLLGRGQEIVKSLSSSLLILTCDGKCYRLSSSPNANRHGLGVMRLRPLNHPIYLDGSGRNMEHVITACRVDDAVVAAHLISRLEASCGGRIVWTDTTNQEILVSYFENGEMKGDQRYKEELEGKLKTAMVYFNSFMNGGIVPVVDHTPEELDRRKKERDAMTALDKEYEVKAKEVVEAISAQGTEQPTATPAPVAEAPQPTPAPAEAANDPVAA